MRGWVGGCVGCWWRSFCDYTCVKQEGKRWRKICSRRGASCSGSSSSSSSLVSLGIWEVGYFFKKSLQFPLASQSFFFGILWSCAIWREIRWGRSSWSYVRILVAAAKHQQQCMVFFLFEIELLHGLLQFLQIGISSSLLSLLEMQCFAFYSLWDWAIGDWWQLLAALYQSWSPPTPPPPTHIITSQSANWTQNRVWKMVNPESECWFTFFLITRETKTSCS